MHLKQLFMLLRVALTLLTILIVVVVVAGYLTYRSVCQHEQRIVFLLQNHHELRATGGFLGSVIVLGAHPHQWEWQTYDIYSLSGQVHTSLESPPGHREFLSGNQRLQLPDANWWPDVPTSSQTLIPMLQEAGIERIALVVYINTQTVQDVLAAIGPLPLPDYQTNLSSDTLFSTIFAARGEFFPGSTAKATVIDRLATQLRIQLSTVSLSTATRLVQTVNRNIKNRNLTLYSPMPKWQQVLRWLRVDGSIWSNHLSQPDTLLLFPVETNVGINKANAGVTRDIRLTEQSATTSELSITWTNVNPASASARPELSKQPGAQGADHLHYVQYFRLYTLPTTTITNIKSTNPELTSNTLSTITDTRGHHFSEYGLLIPVPAGDTTSITFSLAHAPLQPRSTVILARQAGLTGTTYDLQLFNGKRRVGSLESDLIWQPSVQ